MSSENTSPNEQDAQNKTVPNSSEAPPEQKIQQIILPDATDPFGVPKRNF